MKPLPEAPRFPGLNNALIAIVSLVPSSGLVYLVYKILLSTEEAINSLAYIEQLVRLISIGLGVLLLSMLIFIPLITSIINHLTGRDHFGDKSSAISMFAEAYATSENYVLPYAYHFLNKRDEYFCELYLSFSYAEILHAYQTLKKRHRITYQFHTLSLPNHLGRRTPLLTRAGAEQLLRDMTDSANATNSDVQKQRAILRYSFWPNCPGYIDLPDHQVFISRSVVRDLFAIINAGPGYTAPANAEVNAYYDAERIIALSTDYLHTTYYRIATEDELVYLPISPA